MKVRDAIRVIEAAGWRFVRQTGSHRQYRHPTRKGMVTVAGKPGGDIPEGTWRNILRQAGLQP